MADAKTHIEADEWDILFLTEVDVIAARNLTKADTFGKSDPYAILQVGPSTRQTKTIQKTLDPVWNEHFSYIVDQRPSELHVRLFDADDHGKDDSLGELKIPLADGFNEHSTKEIKTRDEWFPLPTKGDVHLKIQTRAIRPMQTEKLLARTESQLDATTAELKQKTSELEIATNELAQLKEIAAKQQQSISQLTDNLAERTAQLEKTRSELVEKTEQLAAAATRLENEKKQHKSDMERVQHELDQAKAASKASSEEIKSLNSQLSKARDGQEQESKKLAEAHAHAKQQDQELEALRRQLLQTEERERQSALAAKEAAASAADTPLLETNNQSLPCCVCFGSKCIVM